MTDTFDWTAVAPAWEARRAHVSRSQSGIEDALVGHLALRPGDAVLELGGGTGDLARRLAAAVSGSGSVTCSDAAAGMVATIRRTVADLPQVAVARIDAADIPLPDGSVDAVVCQMSLMFVADPVTATSEIHRVLRPGGRIVVATWAAPEHNPWLAFLGMAAMMHGVVAGGPPTGPGGVFSLGDPEVLRGVVQDGGFPTVQVDELAVEMRYADPQDYVDHVSQLAGPLAAALAAAPAQAEAVRATAAELIARFDTASGLVVPGRALIARATA